MELQTTRLHNLKAEPIVLSWCVYQNIIHVILNAENLVTFSAAVYALQKMVIHLHKPS